MDTKLKNIYFGALYGKGLLTPFHLPIVEALNCYLPLNSVEFILAGSQIASGSLWSCGGLVLAVV